MTEDRKPCRAKKRRTRTVEEQRESERLYQEMMDEQRAAAAAKGLVLPHDDTDDEDDGRGWEVVCPDGRIRSYPYHNAGDAKSDANHRTIRKCQLWKKPSALDLAQPPCPEGVHRARPMAEEKA